MTTPRPALALALAAATLATAAPVASAAIKPYLSAVAPVCDASGQDTGTHVEFWGWRNTEGADSVIVPIGGSNFFYPGLDDRGQPTGFTGDHQDFAIGVTWAPATQHAPVWGINGDYGDIPYAEFDPRLTLVCASAPEFVTFPAVAGNPAVGRLLTATPGRLSGTPAPEPKVQWQRLDAASQAWQAIPDATGSTYRATAEDAGSPLRVEVTATNGIGDDVTAQSDPTAPVGVKPAKAALPAIAGTPKVGQDLTTDGGQWVGSPAPASRVVRWERCAAVDCKTIGGTAGATTYHTLRGDAGRTLRVVVVATSTAGSSPQVTSRETPVIAK